jgi:hypothetical protein
MTVLDPIPVSLPVELVVKRLRLARRGGETLARELLAEAAPLLRPRAVFREAFIEAKGEAEVVVEGWTFRSLILRKNLDKAEKLYPFVLTVGGGLEERAAAAGDILHQYDLETLADLAIESAAEHLSDLIGRRFGLENLSGMSPGSLEDWPITEQTPLFDLLGDVAKAVGVRLTESLLMVPRKSVSGVLFAAEETFVSCRLCPRDKCQGRRAAYDEDFRLTYGV